MPIARPINFGPLAKGVARGVPEVLVGMDKWTEDTSHNDGLDVGLPKEVEAMVSKANDRMDDANFILFQWGSNRCGGSQLSLAAGPKSTQDIISFISKRMLGYRYGIQRSSAWIAPYS